jgi:hypothetical protein
VPEIYWNPKQLSKRGDSGRPCDSEIDMCPTDDQDGQAHKARERVRIRTIRNQQPQLIFTLRYLQHAHVHECGLGVCFKIAGQKPRSPLSRLDAYRYIYEVFLLVLQYPFSFYLSFLILCLDHLRSLPRIIPQ